MTPTDPLIPEPRHTHEDSEPADVGGQDQETAWLLAAALIQTRRQGNPHSRDAVAELLAEISAEYGAAIITRVVLGLTDVAAALLETGADSLKERPHTVLHDALSALRDAR